MIEQIPPLAHLAKLLQTVPYLASKNLYRVVNHLLTIDERSAQTLCHAIMTAKREVARCAQCCCWKEVSKGCLFCSNSRRDMSVICVVESWHEVLALERAGGYRGLYHVLGGALSPLEGIGIEDLSIATLLGRIDERVCEIILATNQTPEGEATAMYIASKLKNRNVLVSCLARGLPVGSNLEVMDHLTVSKALAERRPF